MLENLSALCTFEHYIPQTGQTWTGSGLAEGSDHILGEFLLVGSDINVFVMLTASLRISQRHDGRAHCEKGIFKPIQGYVAFVSWR
jgi:hypothetical protein